MRALLLWVFLAALVSCDSDYADLAAARQEYARKHRGHIVLAAIDAPWATSYVNGIRLAVRQLNERPGKLLGRPVELLVKSGRGSFDDDQRTILGLVKDPRVTGVFGHRQSEIAIPASVIYEAGKVIFMPPFATASGLTGHDFKFVFRMAPKVSIMAEQIASVAELLGYRNVVLLYAQGDNNRELAFLFEDAAIERGIGFIHRRSFSAGETDYRDVITQFANKPADMVFLSADAASSAQMVRQLREMGVTAPVMGSDALNDPVYTEAVGTAGDNTIAPIVYRAEAVNQTNRAFASAYEAMFGAKPDQNAAQGFDSVRLLASAIEQAKSTVPTLVSSTLHFMPYWTGVTGVHAFDAQGDVTGKKYFFQVLRDGEWRFLPAVHMPYFLERFDRLIQAQSSRPAGLPSFGKQFSTNLHEDDLRIVQLDFLHEILPFQKLGVIYGEDKADELPDKVVRMIALGQKRGFSVDACKVALPEPNPQRVERQLLDCYGKLSILVNALNVTNLPGVDKATVVHLQKPLRQYKIPVLALQGDVDFDDGMAVRIDRFGARMNLQTDYYLNLFNGVLHGIKMYELSARLNNLPILAVNLQVLNNYGLLRSGTLVGLAPDLYLEWLVSSQYKWMSR